MTATYTKNLDRSGSHDEDRGSMYKYACHERSYSMAGILAGARAEEKKADEAAGNKTR